jgi:hypothetical protein
MGKAEKVRVSQEIQDFSRRFVNRHRGDVESILYYPHPFTKGGVVLVFKDGVGFLPDLISDAYRELPQGISLHCLRCSELFELSLPGLFMPPMIVNEQPHLSFWIKHKAILLYGRDIKDEIDAPPNPKMLLEAHIEGCLLYLRDHGILRWLTRKDYGTLIRELDAQLRYLMAIALLAHDIWDVDKETVFDRFKELYHDREIEEIWQAFSHSIQDVADKNSALEAVWLFERFLRRMRRI